MNKLILVITSLFLVGCGQPSGQRKSLSLSTSGHTTVILSGVLNQSEVRLEASKLNVKVNGEEIVILSGDSNDIEKLNFETAEDFDYIQDTLITAELPQTEKPQSELLYLARKDMGVLELLQENPKADGRGVKVGVIDDGISPHQAGFTITSDGERKLLKKSSNSSFSTYSLIDSEQGLYAEVIEKKPSFSEFVDLNADGNNSSWKVLIPKDSKKACIDLNNNQKFDANECKGAFSETGEYFLLQDARLALLFELDLENKKIQFFQPERNGDSHGEGVAGVLAGYKIGNLKGFDGVAPGATILDYDLSEATDKASEKEYSIATFLSALEWMGKEGADVANISYSLFFTNTKAQTFMAKAIEKIVKKYNIVISFSAGNNGPGLGSLNRRGIYPPSVLIAGAYVSKELDEIVHGVTGLPDEGRVVYYSSRGPGLGVGPVLITPLSSLVPSTPDAGHRAFSGTSSASPALAGSAAVLISALKQEGIAVDAMTVVQALKLSGRRLKNEPFIFQGYGLPQVHKALRIYKQLVNGTTFGDIKIITEDKSDGISHSGLMLRTSESKGVSTKRISITGITSSIAAADARVNLLVPVRIEYPKGVNGARNLWISHSPSSFFIDIDVAEVISNKLEQFSEIKVISEIDNTLLAIIPITVIQDHDVREYPSTILNLSAQQGLRFPLNAPAGVQGFKASFSILAGDRKNLVVSIFDPNGIRVLQQRLNADLWVPTTVPGLYQIGLSMVGGTTKEAKVLIQVTPQDLRLNNRLAREKDGSISVTNFGIPFSGTLRLTPKSELIERVTMSSSDLANGARIIRELPEGNYALSMKPFESPYLSYLNFTCSIHEEVAGEELKLNSNTSFTVSAKGAKITAQCMPFDFGAVFDEIINWELRLEKIGKSINYRIDIISDQTISIKTNNLPTGVYQVDVVDPFNNSATEIGVIEII